MNGVRKVGSGEGIPYQPIELDPGKNLDKVKGVKKTNPDPNPDDDKNKDTAEISKAARELLKKHKEEEEPKED